MQMFHRLRRGIAVFAAIAVVAGATGCGGGGDATHGGSGGLGTLFFSQDGNGSGLYTLDLTTGAATLVGGGATGTSSSTIGLTETADPEVLLGSTYSQIAEIATDGSGATVFGGSAQAEGLAMHIGTGVLFSAINAEFRTLDASSGVVLTALAPPPADIEGLGVDPNSDVLYTVARLEMDFFVYNIGTNTWSTIGSTGVSWINPGLAFDHLNNVAYATDGDSDSLYRIDPATGAATLVGPLGTGAGGGLAFVAD